MYVLTDLFKSTEPDNVIDEYGERKTDHKHTTFVEQLEEEQERGMWKNGKKTQEHVSVKAKNDTAVEMQR